MAIFEHADPYALVIPRTVGEILADMLVLAREYAEVDGSTLRDAISALDQVVGAETYNLDAGPLKWRDGSDG